MPFHRPPFVPSVFLQKKQTAASYHASAGKIGNEERWAQIAMSYLHERRPCNDARKRQSDVHAERCLSRAFDRYNAVHARHFRSRLTQLQRRLSHTLEVLQTLSPPLLSEALLPNAAQPPGSVRRPAWTPPRVGYAPGFGLDVPPLRQTPAGYPQTRRPTDAAQFGPEAADFPLCDVNALAEMTATGLSALAAWHGAGRAAAQTGVEGEAAEAYVALQKKALARQALILDLCSDGDLARRYRGSAAVRREEWERRGMWPLALEEEGDTREVRKHFAQEPAYQPFREH